MLAILGVWDDRCSRMIRAVGQMSCGDGNFSPHSSVALLDERTVGDWRVATSLQYFVQLSPRGRTSAHLGGMGFERFSFSASIDT